jgi:hypothetical protein
VKKVGVNYYICRGRKCVFRSLSPAMPTWKLDVDTLKIFLNQEAIKWKRCFRRPTLIQYFLLDLWCRFTSCRFLPAYFLYPLYLHTRVYTCAIVCWCLSALSVFSQRPSTSPNLTATIFENCQFRNSTHVLSRQLYKSTHIRFKFSRVTRRCLVTWRAISMYMYYYPLVL